LYGSRVTNLTVRHTEFDWNNGTAACASGVTKAWQSGTNTSDVITIEHNYFHHSSGFALYLGNFTGRPVQDHYTIANNYFYANGGGGSATAHWELMWLTDLKNSTIYNNTIEDTYGSVDAQTGWIMLGGADNVKIFGNLLFCSTNCGFGGNGTIGTWSNDTYRCNAIHIYNNTFANLSGGYGPKIYFFHNSTPDTDVQVKNNLYYNAAFSWQGVTLQSNEACGGGQGCAGTNAQTGLTTAKFMDYAGRNFRLTSATNAGDAAIVLPTRTDMDGKTRGADGVWDRGAFEFGGTAPAPDTQAPSAPTNLSATATSSTQINLSWTASTDNVGVTGYRILRGGTQVGTSATTSFSNTGLTPSTAYNYTVTAVDAAGNVSAPSAVASVTTQAAPTAGTVRYIRAGATATGSGLDWTNAFPAMPATLTRGATYYLADGAYGSYTFDDPNSGTSTIYIRKATVADHGTETGWLDTYGDGQATFTHWNVYTDYYDINGVTRNADWRLGTLSQYGIRVAGGSPVRLDNGSGTGGDNLTFQYVDIQGGGRDTGAGDDVIYGLTGNSHITFRHCALHDSDRTIFLMRGNWQNLTVDHCYMARNTSTPAIHGELLSMTESTNVTWSHNVMEDIEGTAFIAGINGGTATDWKVFGNVALHTAAYAADTGRRAGHNFGVSGFIFVANDASNNNTGNNFQVYNNTFYNIQGLWSGIVIQRGTGNTVQNNVWYNSTRTATSGAAASNNWYFNTQRDGDSSTSSVTCTTNCGIFVNAAGRDFRLAAPTPAGATFAAPFTVDPDGKTRGADGVWDRGAYEFSGAVAPNGPPVAPRGLRFP
jgi:chitodextrinase